MTLDEFVKAKHAEVEAFRGRWQEAHQKAPEAYPLEMPEGDQGLWDEQLFSFDMYEGPFETPDESDNP